MHALAFKPGQQNPLNRESIKRVINELIDKVSYVLCASISFHFIGLNCQRAIDSAISLANTLLLSSEDLESQLILCNVRIHPIEYFSIVTSFMPVFISEWRLSTLYFDS